MSATEGTGVDLQRWLSSGVAAIDDWQAAFGPLERHPALRVSDEQFASAFSRVACALRRARLIAALRSR